MGNAQSATKEQEASSQPETSNTTDNPNTTTETSKEPQTVSYTENEKEVNLARSLSQLASPLDPHHSVNIDYPCEQLVEPGESVVILMPDRVRTRYEPLPLVPDAAVQANFPALNYSDSNFHVLYHATDELDEEFTGTDDLIADMNRCIEHVGSTSLQLIAFLRGDEDMNDGRPDPTLRFRRSTKFYLPGSNGLCRFQTSLYETKLSFWDPYVKKAPSEAWLSDMIILLYQANDRAVRHVRYKFRCLGFTDEEVFGTEPWKTSRSMPINKGIVKMGTIMNKTELGHHNESLADDDKIEQCPSCLEDYSEEGSSDAVMLHCSQKHCVCLECMQRWCEQNGLDKVTCPWDRQKLASPDMLALMVPNYLDINATFVNDPRYTAYENSERSCADLDRVHAKHDWNTVSVDPEVIADAWIQLVQFPFLPCDPTHLTPLVAHETELFRETLFRIAEEVEGERYKLCELYISLRRSILIAMNHEYLQTGADKYLTELGRQQLIENPHWAALRPGYQHYIEKSLHRVLRFLTVRACSEYHDPTSSFLHSECNPKGYHLHGDRVFWRAQDLPRPKYWRSQHPPRPANET